MLSILATPKAVRARTNWDARKRWRKLGSSVARIVQLQRLRDALDEYIIPFEEVVSSDEDEEIPPRSWLGAGLLRKLSCTIFSVLQLTVLVISECFLYPIVRQGIGWVFKKALVSATPGLVKLGVFSFAIRIVGLKNIFWLLSWFTGDSTDE